VSAAPRPGWYPDPAGTPELYRWWDGGDWTAAISESPRAPSPLLHSPARPEDDLVRRRPSRVRSLVALLLCLALFLSATIGLGLAIWEDGSAVQRSARLPLASPAAPMATTGSVGRLDQQTRVATIGSASMTLPGEPYWLSPDPMQTAGLDVCFLASAPVHPRYDGRHSWTSAVLLGRLPAGPSGQDLPDRGRAVAHQLARTLFNRQATRLEKLAMADHSVDGSAGLLVTAEVHYTVDRLPSRYDVLTVVLVQLDDGSVVAAVSSVPDDSSASVADLAEQALDSLTVS
jgi:Protein of unknown function (DUF2510)